MKLSILNICLILFEFLRFAMDMVLRFMGQTKDLHKKFSSISLSMVQQQL